VPVSRTSMSGVTPVTVIASEKLGFSAKSISEFALKLTSTER
jgi:hypothetical protein